MAERRKGKKRPASTELLEHVALRLPPAVLAQAKAQAERADRPLSRHLRKLLTAAIEAEEKVS